MTIKEIAKLANCSAGTVDRVIHNRGKVNQEKRELITRLLEETNFQPNLYAVNLKMNKEKVVGYLTPTLTSEEGYWNMVYQGVIAAQADLRDPSFKIKVFEYDRSVQGAFLEASRKMLAEGIDYCVMIAKNPREATQFLKDNSSLSYILVDSDVDGAKPLTTIGQNPYAGGELAGKVLSLWAHDASVFLTFSFRDSVISRERIHGFRNYAEDKKIEVVERNIDSIDDIPILLSQELSSKKIDGIFVPFFAGFKVASVLSKSSQWRGIPIVTYDLNSSNRDALKDGRLQCILSQRPVFQGYSSIWQIYRAAVLHEEIAQKVVVQVDILFKENLPSEFRADGKTQGRNNQYCIPKETDYFWST